LVEERDVSQESHKSARVMVNGHQESSLDYVTIASSTEGYSPADLQDLVAGAAQQAMIRSAKSGESKVWRPIVEVR
jgi:peroxin-1